MRHVLVLLLGLFLCGPAFAAFNDGQRADLKRISDYLNSIRSAQGRFVQIGPDGKSDDGTFYLRKPGRVRFEYAKPNPNVIVADGSTLAVENSALKNTESYPLVDSPLLLLLADKVDLTGDTHVTQVRREPGTLSVTARQTSGQAQGQITLLFADSGSTLELRQWEVLDAQGLRTLIAITSLQSGVTLNPRLFIIRELNPFSGRPR